MRCIAQKPSGDICGAKPGKKYKNGFCGKHQSLATSPRYITKEHLSKLMPASIDSIKKDVVEFESYRYDYRHRAIQGGYNVFHDRNRNKVYRSERWIVDKPTYLTKKETVEMVDALLEKWGVNDKPIRIKFLDGRKTSDAGYSDINFSTKDGKVEKQTLLHEVAHTIEYRLAGSSDHQAGWIAIYSKLLEEEYGVEVVNEFQRNLTQLRVDWSLESSKLSIKKAVEKAKRNAEEDGKRRMMWVVKEVDSFGLYGLPQQNRMSLVCKHRAAKWVDKTKAEAVTKKFEGNYVVTEIEFVKSHGKWEHPQKYLCYGRYC